MYFELYMPYDASIDCEKSGIDGYYKNAEEYVEALDESYRYDKRYIINAVNTGRYDVTDFRNERQFDISENIEFSGLNVRLIRADNYMSESVDSMIDKFATQKPFLVEFEMLSSSKDGKFEEELSQWWKDTRAVLIEGKKFGSKCDEWLDRYIPKRDMKLSFLNKSNVRVTFTLEGVELEEKINNKDYVLYVSKMSYQK